MINSNSDLSEYRVAECILRNLADAKHEEFILDLEKDDFFCHLDEFNKHVLKVEKFHLLLSQDLYHALERIFLNSRLSINTYNFLSKDNKSLNMFAFNMYNSLPKESLVTLIHVHSKAHSNVVNAVKNAKTNISLCEESIAELVNKRRAFASDEISNQLWYKETELAMYVLLIKGVQRTLSDLYNDSLLDIASEELECLLKS